MFLLFVDLHKAYDSVPRTALWCSLQKYGIPDVMIEFVQTLHDGMSATVTAGCGKLAQFGMVCIKGVPSLPLCLSCTLG